MSKERGQVLAHELLVGSACTPRSVVQSSRDTRPGVCEVCGGHCNKPGWHESMSVRIGCHRSSRKIARYVVCKLPDNDCPETFVVGHLKVDAKYQR